QVAGGSESDRRVRLDVLPEPVTTPGGPARIVIGVAPLVPLPDRFLTEGVQVGVAHELARATPRAKSARFALERRPHPLAVQDDYDRLLLDPPGRILEGTSCNFFAIRDAALHTAAEGMLEGITRKFILELAGRMGVPIVLEAPRL